MTQNYRVIETKNLAYSTTSESTRKELSIWTTRSGQQEEDKTNEDQGRRRLLEGRRDVVIYCNISCSLQNTKIQMA